jgi:LAGLIDADG DNA endonuclease family
MLKLLNLNTVDLLHSMQVRFYSNGSLPLTLFAKNVIIGLILGDATLVRKYPNGNAYLQYAQSIKHSEYMDLVFSILKPFCNMSSPRLSQAKVRGNSYDYLAFSTRSLPYFTEFHTLFYPNGIKLIPSNIIDLLTPVGLAFLAQDDGSKCSK